jgi:hypothetical protein
MTATLDHEVVELLANDPELLALADAVAAAGEERVHEPRRVGRRAVAGSIALAAAIALALVAPWSHGGATFVDRARAAIGQAPVLHAVTREILDQGETVVDLRTGDRTPIHYVQEQEVWFDQDGQRAHTITRTNGIVTDDTLETAAGGVSMDGPVITCAWIARHPAEATKLRVSCRFDGDNSKMTTIDFPKRPPSVDPALGGFLTQYRDALATGRAKDAGDGEIDGRPVRWLSLSIDVPTDPTAPPVPAVDQRELVAIDRDTYRPVLVRTVVDGAAARSYRVVEIGTMSRDDANFAKPEPRPARPTIGETVGKTEVTAAEATHILGQSPLSVGRTFDGLELASIERVDVRTGYARSTGVPTRLDVAVRLRYEDPSGRPRVTLFEATRPLYAFGWIHGPLAAAIDLPAGHVALFGFGGFVVRDGVYVAIQAPLDPDPNRVIAVARALRPIG